ncbi:hypothetical protein [Bosea sp. 2RAB26]|uniref:hypothetical protein n=1 Tax=Bosea sp. 2RAB26 TaxID=3237476 RepID=UPI003F9059BB
MPALGAIRLNERSATHLAPTIETADLSAPWDICVIDEIQMLDDAQRGWAWTAAAIGVNAEHVVMTGSPYASTDRRAARDCAPQAQGRTQTLDGRLTLDDVTTSDAVIAISRREVLEYRERLIRAGHSVADDMMNAIR